MLKFDPDEDDEDGPAHSTPHKSHTGGDSTLSTPPQDGTPHGARVTPLTPMSTGDPLSSPVTPNPAERGNFPYTQQDTRVSSVLSCSLSTFPSFLTVFCSTQYFID